MTIRSEPEHGESDASLCAIMGERRQLTNLAYRLLGSLAEAEDVVQETYARWYAMDRQQQEAIDSPGAWLTKVASRICLDLLASARTRRERYVGEWIPEPLPERTEWINGQSGDSPVDPADRVTLDESITMAFLVVLESMTPAERVAFTLHDVSRYSFAEVAEIVGRTPAACRQLASSARRRIHASQAPAGGPIPIPDSAGGVTSRAHPGGQADGQGRRRDGEAEPGDQVRATERRQTQAGAQPAGRSEEVRSQDRTDGGRHEQPAHRPAPGAPPRPGRPRHSGPA